MVDLTKLIFFNFCTLMVAMGFYKTKYYDPGRIPLDYKWTETVKRASFEGQRGNLRYCKQCRVAKPDRSHHCSRCDKCTLKMDHHCQWTLSCVGFNNYKYFLMLLFWASWGVLFLLLTQYFKVKFIYYKEERTIFEYLLVIDWLMSFSVLFGSGSLGIIHTQLVFKNITTLEWMEKWKHQTHAYANPYDIDPVSNWVQVFGKNPFLWFFPVNGETSGDGIFYPLRDDIHDFEE